MVALIVFLLLLWLVLSIIGAVVEGLFWLLVVGLVLLVITGAWGWFKMRGGRRSAAHT